MSLTISAFHPPVIGSCGLCYCYCHRCCLYIQFCHQAGLCLSTPITKRLNSCREGKICNTSLTNENVTDHAGHVLSVGFECCLRRSRTEYATSCSASASKAMSEPVGGSLLRSGALPSDTADMPRPCSALLSVCRVGVAASLCRNLLAVLLAGWEGVSLLPSNDGSA